MECWASCLGDCGGGPSREHYISDGIFDAEEITVFGLAWCRDKPITVTLGSAVSKILCENHNAALSPYDNEAAKLSRFLSSNVLDNPLRNDAVTLNGVHLEKWSLKTMLNLGYMGALDQPTFRRVEPAETLVRYLFRDAVLLDGVGLYLLSGGLSNESYNTGVSWNAIRNVSAGGEVAGMTFTLNSIRFVVSAVQERAEEYIRNMGFVAGVDYSKASVCYRPANIVLDSPTAGRKQINLEW